MRANRQVLSIALLSMLVCCVPAARANPPDWLRTAAASASTPVKYSDEIKEVILLEDRTITIQTDGRVVTHVRWACKILRTSGCEEGILGAHYNKDSKINSMTGWTITASGKEFEVKEKDATEFGDVDVAAIEFSDLRVKVLELPAAEPGNVVGFEYETQEQPYFFQDTWEFQGFAPVLDARFTLLLPPGWEYKAHWLNFGETQPQQQGSNQWQWELRNISAIAKEKEMPPERSIEGRMIVDYFPNDPSLRQKAFDTWRDFGRWYIQIYAGRRDDSPEISAKVKELTATAATPLDKIRALAGWVQHDIRYYAVALGIGGLQPHFASKVFVNRYGDCKDKATLLSTMLRDAGIDSYPVIINHQHDVVHGGDPPWNGFDHVILAIRLPAEVPTTSLYATYKDPQLGTLLFFDPTSRSVSFGYIPEYLQANYAMLVTDQGGELVELPILPGATNRLIRSASLTLGPDGTLQGKVREIRWGGPAFITRGLLLEDSSGTPLKALESFLSTFLEGFELVNDNVENLRDDNQNLIVDYQFSATNYAQSAGNLLIVRPRVLGEKGSTLLEEKERKYPVELGGTTVQTDIFEIALPPGYVVDELPPAAHVDYPFGSYTSKTECDGKVLRYTRNFEVKTVVVPTDQLSDLKKFYEQITEDEDASAVLKRAAN